MRNKRNSSRRATAAAACLSILAAACSAPPPPPAPPPAAVTYVTVQPRELPLSLEYAAQLRGVREVEVRARVSGVLLERLFREGEAVEAGDLLFRIDPDPFQAEAARARAELGVREADLRQAERERDRVLPLYEQGLASVRERDGALATYEAAAASAAAAEAALHTAELQLSYTEVRAPISGLTSREVRSEGSLVTAGDDSSLLTYIVQADRLYADFSVPGDDAGLLQAAVTEDDGNVFVRLVGADGQATGARARIEYIAPRVDETTGTVAVRALLDNSDNSLLPGRIVRVRVEGVRLDSALVIPKRAVMRGGQGTFVWLIDDAEAVMPQPVELGVSSGNDTTVISGLSAGDRIVADGILKAQPGATVTATPLGAPEDDTATPVERASQ